MKPILDLFCCAGGSGKGIFNSGKKVIGIDIEPQPEYPFEFLQKDVFELEPEWIKENFSAIWASPKCQKFSIATNSEQKQEEVNQIPGTKKLLDETGLPYVIENVPNAPLRNDLMLCGEMFGLRVIRHRIFEIKGFFVPQPEHKKHKPPSDFPLDFWNEDRDSLIIEPIKISKQRSYYAQVAGHGGDSYSYKLQDHQKAMGIDWITDREHLTQAIPPIYSEYIFRMLNFQLSD